MPKFLEEQLKNEYPGDDSAVYGTMNKIGAMHGSKETAKGRAMEAKHETRMSAVKRARASHKTKKALNGPPQR